MPTSTKPLALLYGRVSTDEKTQASMPDQVSMGRRRAMLLGAEVPEDGVFTDTQTRAIFHRPGLQALLARVVKGDIRYVIVWQSSRLYGDIEQMVRIYSILKQAGVQLVNEGGEIENLPGSMNTAMSSLKAVMHQLEVDQVRERVHGTHSNKARLGQIIQKPVFGIKVDDQGWRIDDAEHSIVIQIFTWAANGKSSTWICDELNARGLTTQMGCAWHNHNLRRMLRNRIYCGELVWNKTRNIIVTGEDGKDKKKQIARPESEWIYAPSPLGPLVDAESFAAAGRAIAARHNERGGGRGNRTHEPRLLTGLVYCAKCNKKMYPRKNGRANNTTFYFTCAAQCQTIAESKLMESIFDMEPANPERALNVSERTAPPQNGELARLENTLVALKRQTTKNYQAWVEDMVDDEMYRETSETLRKRTAAATEALAALNEAEASGGSLGPRTHAALLKQALDGARDERLDLDARRAGLALVIERVVFDRPDLDLFWCVPRS